MTSAATAAAATADLLGFTVDEGEGGADVDVFPPSPDDHQQRGQQQQPKDGVTETKAVVSEGREGRGNEGRLESAESPKAAGAPSALSSASEQGDVDTAESENRPLDPLSAPAPSHPSELAEDDGGGGGATAASDDDYETPPEEDGSSSGDDGRRANAEASDGDGGGGALRQRRQAAIDAINAIHLEMDELEARAKLDETSAALVHELVTQICCRLDGIDTHGSDEVRSMRRAAIARAEGIDNGGCCGTGSDAGSQRDGDALVPMEPERRGLDGINPFDEFRDVLPSPPATKPEDRSSGTPAPPSERKPIMNNASAAAGGGMDVFMNATTSGGNIADSNVDDEVDRDKQNDHMIIGPVQNSVVLLDPATATSGTADGESTTDQNQPRQEHHPIPTNASTAQQDLLGRATAQRSERGQPQAQGQKNGSRETSDASLPLVPSAAGSNGAGTGGNADVFAGLFGAPTDGGGGDDDVTSSAAPPTPPAPMNTDTTPTPPTARSSVGNLSVDEIVLAAPSSLVPSTPPVTAHGKMTVPPGGAGGELTDLGIGLFDGDQGDDNPSLSPTPAVAAAAGVPATEASEASQSATGAAPAPAPSSFSSSPQMQNLKQQLDAWEATRASAAAAAAPVSPTGSADGRAAAAAPADDDPFGIFGGGGGNVANDRPMGNGVGGTGTDGASPGHSQGPIRVGSGSGPLPPDGVTYETKIYAARVGIMFLTARHLTDTLFLAVPDDEKRRLLFALGERPVVAFMVEGSGGLDAGVKLGHVLLSVDGSDVSNPVDAQRRIAEGPRPLPVKFYIPDVPIVSAEGMHMVKYDVNTTYAPSTSGEWKLKYVVVGGVIAKKWQINMYRSKADYDEAVSAVLAGRPIPVKIKQFSLVGGSRMLDDGDVKTVRYNDRPKAWRYVVVERPEIPGSFPIKIAHGSVEGLRPVMRGIQYAMAGRNETKLPTAKTGRKGKSNPGFFQPMLGRKAKKKSSKTKI